METQTPESEALQLLSQVIEALSNPPFDLKANLRKCQHACEILGWQSKRDWFHQELNGYWEQTPTPTYRFIPGSKRFSASGSIGSKSRWTSEDMVYGVDEAVYEIEPDTLEVRAGIDWLTSRTQFGYSENLEETKNATSPSGRSTMELRRQRVFTAGDIAYAVSQIEKQAFDFASISYAQLRFGDIIGDIWARYRRDVDAAMTDLNLSAHLASIEGGLLSENPEDWRSATFECRNLLNDLANHLWRDPRPRYEHLQGSTDEGTLDVTQGKFGNRLAAYIHQKGVSGTRGRFIREEAHRLAASIQSLIPFQSEAHEPIEFSDSQSIAIATYVLVGEIAKRTDLNPIEEYGEPAINGAS
jgi:hypothetical protein